MSPQGAALPRGPRVRRLLRHSICSPSRPARCATVNPQTRTRESADGTIRSRDCDGPLLQLLAVVGPIDGLSVIARSCPDCGRQDTVVAEHAAVEAWQRRDARTANWMEAAADAQAAELAGSGTALR